MTTTSDATAGREGGPEAGAAEETMTNGSGKPRPASARKAARPARKRARAKPGGGRKPRKSTPAARPRPAGGEPEQMPDNELVAAVLAGEADAEGAELGHRILKAVGGVAGLSTAGRRTIAGIDGASMRTAQQLRAAVELGRRSNATRDHGMEVETPQQAAEMASAKFGNHRRKHLVALLLDERMQPCAQRTICIGASEPDDEATRELLWSALESCTPMVCLMANHPSGNAMPTRGEMKTCGRLREACALVGITLVDYVIVAGRQFYSFRQGGLIEGDGTRYVDKPAELPAHAGAGDAGSPDDPAAHPPPSA